MGRSMLGLPGLMALLAQGTVSVAGSGYLWEDPETLASWEEPAEAGLGDGLSLQ